MLFNNERNYWDMRIKKLFNEQKIKIVIAIKIYILPELTSITLNYTF